MFLKAPRLENGPVQKEMLNQFIVDLQVHNKKLKKRIQKLNTKIKKINRNK